MGRLKKFLYNATLYTTVLASLALTNKHVRNTSKVLVESSITQVKTQKFEYKNGEATLSAYLFYPTYSFPVNLFKHKPTNGFPLLVGIVGSGGFHSDYIKYARFITGFGYAVVIPSYRSLEQAGTDKLFLAKQASDVEIGINLIKEKSEVIDSSKIVLMGGSLGAAIAIELLTNGVKAKDAILFNPPCRLKIIYDNAMFSDDQVLRHAVATIEKDLNLDKLSVKEKTELLNSLSLLPKVSKININGCVYIIQGETDDIVPAKEAEALHEELIKLGKNARLIRTPGSGAHFVYKFQKFTVKKVSTELRSYVNEVFEPIRLISETMQILEQK